MRPAEKETRQRRAGARCGLLPQPCRPSVSARCGDLRRQRGREDACLRASCRPRSKRGRATIRVRRIRARGIPESSRSCATSERDNGTPRVDARIERPAISCDDLTHCCVVTCAVTPSPSSSWSVLACGNRARRSARRVHVAVLAPVPSVFRALSCASSDDEGQYS
jgi:hypothetical protein